ncbi:hypothetical protein [Robbsia sp. KACC 23696]|uniref:hypothetical protein n=1 Tax=Robbsia sp. KACC 23696 TaxID=3149231 RepID=UPI00325C1DDE
MAADKTVLLLLSDTKKRHRLFPWYETDGVYLEFPLQWILFREITGAQLIDQSFVLSRIDSFSIARVPAPRSRDTPFLAHLCMLVFGWLFLATPILVRLKLSDSQAKSREDVRELLVQIVSESESGPELLNSVVKRIRRARSLRAMADALMEFYD